MPFVRSREGQLYETPFFMPVFEHGNCYVSTDQLQKIFGIRTIITNAYFLYKNRALKPLVREEGIKRFLGFDGLVVTDSGAFQQFSGPLYLSNKKIIRFQEEIGVDVISPLDLITTPGENRKNATKKLQATLKRIREGLDLIHKGILIGVQQGGRFPDLRGKALEQLVEMGATYIALGSLVPMFNRNHDIFFIGKIILQARRIVPANVPLHLYGGGDPLELPFYIHLGCDIFDSSSFIHYARDGWYMTPFGAFHHPWHDFENLPYHCDCDWCKEGAETLSTSAQFLALHNLWVIRSVMDTVGEHRDRGTLTAYLDQVLALNRTWFPESRLAESWERLMAETA